LTLSQSPAATWNSFGWDLGDFVPSTAFDGFDAFSQLDIPVATLPYATSLLFTSKTYI